jgi:choline dehydrogenase-like flavoprotein
VENPFQVVVAGAGPGGLRLSRDLAPSGIRVAVYEAAAQDDPGHQWSDAVENSALAEAGFELPKLENGTWHGPLVKKEALDDNLFEPHAVASLEIRPPDLSGRTRTDVEFRYITTDRAALNRERHFLPSGPENHPENGDPRHLAPRSSPAVEQSNHDGK